MTYFQLWSLILNLKLILISTFFLLTAVITCHYSPHQRSLSLSQKKHPTQKTIHIHLNSIISSHPLLLLLLLIIISILNIIGLLSLIKTLQSLHVNTIENLLAWISVTNLRTHIDLIFLNYPTCLILIYLLIIKETYQLLLPLHLHLHLISLIIINLIPTLPVSLLTLMVLVSTV